MTTTARAGIAAVALFVLALANLSQAQDLQARAFDWIRAADSLYVDFQGIELELMDVMGQDEIGRTQHIAYAALPLLLQARVRTAIESYFDLSNGLMESELQPDLLQRGVAEREWTYLFNAVMSTQARNTSVHTVLMGAYTSELSFAEYGYLSSMAQLWHSNRSLWLELYFGR